MTPRRSALHGMASEDRGAALASALQPMIAAVVLAYILYQVLKVVLKVSASPVFFKG